MIDDYGPVGKGASQGHFVLAENGNEYMIKGPVFTPNHGYVAANELVAAQIAGMLSLPVLDYCVIEMAGDLYSGSAYMLSATFHPQIDAALFAVCTNASRAYDIVVFDTFVCNIDRHSQNLLVRSKKIRGSALEQHLLLMNDHSHCLVQPGQGPSSLAALLGTPPDRYVGHLDFVRAAITDVASLSTAIRAFEGVSDGALRGLADGLPPQFFPGGGQAEYGNFLIHRRAELRTIFESGRAIFANLEAGSLI